MSKKKKKKKKKGGGEEKERGRGGGGGGGRGGEGERERERDRVSRGTFGRIHIPTYRDRRCQFKRAALTDSSLVDELSYANYFKGQRAPNGIELNAVNNVVKSMIMDMRCISGVGPSNLVVLLTPHGEPL